VTYNNPHCANTTRVNAFQLPFANSNLNILKQNSQNLDFKQFPFILQQLTASSFRHLLTSLVFPTPADVIRVSDLERLFGSRSPRSETSMRQRCATAAVSHLKLPHFFIRSQRNTERLLGPDIFLYTSFFVYLSFCIFFASLHPPTAIFDLQ
jgi:hypothetical protein